MAWLVIRITHYQAELVFIDDRSAIKSCTCCYILLEISRTLVFKKFFISVIIIQIKLGESCKNNGCKNTYQGEDVDYNNCKHHPGIPVFHEGEMNIEE